MLIPLPAATLMLVRDVPGGGTIEVLMLRRNRHSTWVGGAYLFPGGAVDPEDGSPEMAARCIGRSAAEADRVLDISDGGLGYFVAAIRECFEEAGILLASGPGGPVAFDDPLVGRRFEEHRRRLNAGQVGLLEILEAESLQLDVGGIGYFSHWITPEGSPRRYDTRFFVAVVPAGQVALHDDDEVVASLWVSPAEAAARFERGEIDIMFPTLKNIEGVGRFSSTADLLQATEAASVPVILPRVTVTGESPGVRIVLPGDPGYESATGLPEGVPFPHRPQGVRP